MAHAGTPTDLAKQPATSTTSGLWKALLAVIVVLAIGVGIAVMASAVASSRGAAAPAAGHRIEAQRGPTTAAAALVYVEDGSYTQVETNRGGAFMSVDNSYTQVENNRGGALTERGATEPDCSPCANQGATKLQGAPNIGPGRIVGHRGAMIDQ